LEEIDPEITKFEQEWAAKLTNEELHTLNNLLEKLRKQ
jgi:hypothetical protein